MTTATARIPVLMTPGEKKRVVKKAEKAGIPTSQFMRQAAENYEPGKDEEALSLMLEQLDSAAENMSKAIDDCMAYVAESNRRIELLESKARGN